MENSNGSSYAKRPLWQWVLIYVIIGGLAYGLIYYLFISKNTAYNLPGYQSPTSAASGQNPTAASQQKFLDSDLGKNAFEIFPGPLSAKAKQATASFAINTQTLPDGSTQVSLTSTNPEYQNQQYTVMPGYTLYFIEKNLIDDSSTANTEKNLLDDSAVIVDPQGFQVQP